MSVSTLRIHLSEDDIRALLKGETDEDRALGCYRLCRRIEKVVLTPQERIFAEQILHIVVAGAAERVRRALAVTLKASPMLPSSIANRLARDLDSIAIPVLESSPSLTDEDLAEILESAEPARQFAIARRAHLSPVVTTALCRFGINGAIIEALRNTQASFNESGLICAIERFPDMVSLLEAVVERPVLPILVAEKLAALLTGELFDRLVEHHAVPPQLAIDLANDTRERSGVDLIAQAGLQSNLPRYVQQLHLNGRLTPSFVLRALCQGEVRLVEYAFAELAAVPHNKAWLLVHDGGTIGLRALFERAHFPASLYPAFRAAIDVLHDSEFTGSTNDQSRFKKLMIERVLTRFQSIPAEDLTYLLEKLDYVPDHSLQPRRAVG
ncbi:DUF2336 domain-containing protein [Candidatus Phycosocius spiralis]|uniref:DUF2336 domain-containing protein n=1 Tax=Candidatus Phycosocius spiralis TaxID=2815099 RepID=A0ABQ4PSQ6_9PROT|nr:DUF2336 domain-containing protein [Candidatus Phycosocius spiralis]GIU66040.1 hypothetical protein PsB1_0194 [Candidatus Phycosocius spiralis]